jgi:hypothetical protein
MFTGPADAPVTVPAVVMVAIPVFPLIHVPPAGAPVSVVAEPVQITEDPVIDAAALTVTVW